MFTKIWRVHRIATHTKTKGQADKIKVGRSALMAPGSSMSANKKENGVNVFLIQHFQVIVV
jgi:hypothetical protein